MITSPVDPSSTGIGRLRLMALTMSRRGPFSVVNGCVRHAQGFVDAERLRIAHQHRVKDVGAEVRDIVHGAGVQVKGLPLRPDQARVKERKRVPADLHPISPSRSAR